MNMIVPYGRHWAVYADQELVCVCLYKKGATEVKRRLEVAEEEAGPGANRSALQISAANDNERRNDRYDNSTA